MQSFPRIINPISTVHFAGFESTTYRLQKEGWQLSMEQSYEHASLRLAMKHERARLYAISAPVEYQYFHYMKTRYGSEPPPITFNIIHMSGSIQLHLPQSRPVSFMAIDATPTWSEDRVVSFEDAIPFRPLNAEAPEIIVPPQSVPELMELVLKLQDPKQAEIRKNRRREAWAAGERAHYDSQGYNPASDIQAQIITLVS
jgi:hypothetical protein